LIIFVGQLFPQVIKDTIFYLLTFQSTINSALCLQRL